VPVAIGPGAASTPIQEDWTPSQFARLFALTPEGAAEYLAGRERLAITYDWRALWQDEHAQQFTVSRLARLDLLKAIYEGIVQSVGGDLTRRDFARDVTQLLQKSGWWGKVEVMDPDTGELLATRFNPARVKLIYDTNVRMAHAAGRWERIQAAKGTHPYLRYITKDDGRVRDEHAAWHNLTLPVDHPFWRTHYPPNGWRCRCRVVAMSQAEYDRGKSPTGDPLRTKAPPTETVEWVNKYTGDVEQVPVGIDPGFGYNVGVAGQRRAAERRLVETKRASLPPALAAAAQAEALWAGDPLGPLARSATGDDGGAGATIGLGAVDTDTLDGVREVLVSFAVRNTDGWLPHGVRRVVAANLGEATVAATDDRGHFVLGTAPLSSAGGRSGRELITEALTAIKEGRALDFEQEYGIECLWHEILHNSQRHREPPGVPIEQRRLVESLHQTLARQTYPILLRALGRAPAHLTQVRAAGLAYPRAAGRFQALLQKLGLQTAEWQIAPETIDALLALLRETPYDAMGPRLSVRLAAIGGEDLPAIEAALDRIQAGQDIDAP
jgi:SPP1 gp7 family putative phage head morphogenesis protein